jgi:hypothetical protein
MPKEGRDVGKTTLRKLTLVCAAVVALALAGASGAVIRYTIFTIKPSHYARLAGTDVYCLNQDSEVKGLARFYCGRRTNAATNDGWAWANTLEVYPDRIDALVCPPSRKCSSLADHFFPKVKLNKPGH